MEPAGGITASAAPPGLSAGPPRASPHRRGPIAITAAGLLLALAAALAPPEAGSPDAVMQRVVVSLPDWLAAAVAGSVLLAGAIFVAIAMPRPRPRRKKGEDDYEMYHEPRRVPPLLGIALILLALAPGVALTGMLFWFGRDSVGVPSEPSAIVRQHGATAPPAAGAGASPSQEERKAASPVTTVLLGTTAVLAAFGALAFVAWLAFGDRWMRREPFDDRYRAEVAQAVDASLDDLRLEADPRTAILKIYRNFERVLAAAAVSRRSWQTPMEFMRTALAKLPLPRQFAEELTRLFEIARFSDHPLGDDERDRAWRSLIAIRTQIEAAHNGPDGHVS